MNVAEILRASGRRWYVLVVGMLLTGGLAYAALQFVPITYDAKASVLLIPPPANLPGPSQATAVPENPFLHLAGFDIVAGVLAKSLTDSESIENLVPTGGTAEYSVTDDPSVPGSVLEVIASDESARGAFATLTSVLDLAEERLAKLQDSVDASSASQVRLMVITNNTVAEPNLSALLRTLIAVIAAGIALTMLLAVSVDALARRRKARHVARAESPIEEQGTSSIERIAASPHPERERVSPLVRES